MPKEILTEKDLPQAVQQRRQKQRAQQQAQQQDPNTLNDKDRITRLERILGVA